MSRAQNRQITKDLQNWAQGCPSQEWPGWAGAADVMGRGVEFKSIIIEDQTLAHWIWCRTLLGLTRTYLAGPGQVLGPTSLLD